MKISNSKKQLAQIIRENGGWRNGAEFAWYGNQTKKGWFGISKPRYSPKQKSLQILRPHLAGSFPCRKPNNWHQTILSRAEYLHLYPAPDADGWIEWNGGECPVGEGVVVEIKARDGEIQLDQAYGWNWSHEKGSPVKDRQIIAYRLHKPETEITHESDHRTMEMPKPTIEQLAADYRNAKDCAERKQQEADAAKADADGKLKALVSAGVELGLVLGVAKPEPELVIADWRDLEVGDEVEITESHSGERVGKVGTITRFSDSDEIFRVRVHFDGDESDYEWISGWRFIRRP